MYFFTETPDANGNVLKKCYFKYEPYFYVMVKADIIEEFQQDFSKRFEDKIASTEIVEKLDLDMPNHLAGFKRKVLKVKFKNVNNLVVVRNALRPYVQRNKTKAKVLTYSELLNPSAKLDMMDMIIELREDDVPYHTRICIDNEIRCGQWYTVTANFENGCTLTKIPDKLSKCPLTVLAFDIETTKAPLKFPDARLDSIMLISYMIDGDGFLIVNRSIIPEDIEDFDYSPKPEFQGHFVVFNEKDEEALLKRFVAHCKERRPNIFVTFNGDYFDIPFIETRLKVYGMSLETHFGIQNITTSTKPGEGEYMGRFSVHIDCLYWVKRDAFLPVGSHGLKAVTKSKLGYNPIEWDPEKMLEAAVNTPKQFCAYSVSDALATYYLYKMMVHDFIFALCTIIPTNPDEVLRKGSGTLCEELLMAQAYRRNIIFPEKQIAEFEKFYNGHLIDTETYVGANVECLHVGVYRTDLLSDYEIDVSAYEYLLQNVEKFIEFNLRIENKGAAKVEDIENYSEVVEQIKKQLRAIIDVSTGIPNYKSKIQIDQGQGNIYDINKDIKGEIFTHEFKPIIYHLDVGAMYPNIILTNRLQPTSMVNEQICSSCIHNKQDSFCKRYMQWSWRGEMFPLTRSEYENLKKQFEFELLNAAGDANDLETLNVEDHRTNFIKRIKGYCSKVYKQIHVKKVELKEGAVCLRENSFYVDTIRDFRDRRYEFKGLVKKWRAKKEEAMQKGDPEDIQNCKNMMELYESLQLAHKVILNSFYGYAMKKGSRWLSMEMAAMVTHLGSNLIKDARQFVERIGKPLELDTDGIWCCLPEGFPEEYKFKLKNKKTIKFSFPCTMLNMRTYEKYANPQFNYFDKDTNQWKYRTEMSVFFEVDGPYKAMILPAAKEEGKVLKKRYAVFDFDGKITELKGFELKRRGELKIIKIFQGEVFGCFLNGNNLAECYASCAEVAERWYGILEAEGEGIPDEELLEYIEESRMMSKSLEEYGTQKSTSITTIKRLSEILGKEILNEKGLAAKFIISKKPMEAPIAERAIPTTVFQSESNIKVKLLRKWLKDYSIDENIDMRDVIDWEYYKERLAGNILKIIIIPAAIQRVDNPFPSIAYPDWVKRMIAKKNNTQRNLKSFFRTLDNIDKMISVNKSLENISSKPNQGIKGSNLKIKQKGGDTKLDNFFKVKTDLQYEDPEAQDPIYREDPEVAQLEKEKKINITEDFKGWLKQQKKRWKNVDKIKANNERKSVLKAKAQNSSADSTKKEIERQMSFKNGLLNILKIEESECEGILYVWVSFGNFMQKLKINLKRKIYINSMKQNVPDVFRPVKYGLPRNKPMLNLYELELEEKDFLNNFNNFNDYIINPTVEGVYETKVPLDFKLIKQFGRFIKYTGKQRYINFDDVFNASDFEMKEIDLSKYKDISNDLSEDGNRSPSQNQSNIPQELKAMLPNPPNKIYIYNIKYVHTDKQLKQFIIAVIFEFNKAIAVCVDSFAKVNNKMKNSVADIGARIRTQLMKLKEEGAIDNECDLSEFTNLNITSVEESDINEAYKKINNFIGGNASHQPNRINLINTPADQSIILYQGSEKPSAFIERIEMMRKYPIFELPFNKDDLSSWNALMWKNTSAENVALRLVDLNQAVSLRELMSEYANVPLCNLSFDLMLSSTDAMFSRVLTANKQLLWYNSAGFPDLGGGEDSKHDFLGQIESNFPTVNNPGLYMGYVADIDINLFCVNAVLESDHMKDFSGNYDLAHAEKSRKRLSDFKDYREENLSKLNEYKLERDEFVLGANAFVSIKKMVEKWLNDVQNYENVCADYCLIHFYRWICSTESKFYDPVIYRMINLLMEKYFSILIRKITEFGFNIIYADNKKVYLYAKKSNLEEFQNNLDYLIKSIKKIPIFEHIVLSINTTWKMLIFKDLYNFAGIPANEDDDSKSEDESQNGRQKINIISKWNISEFLPPIIEKDFGSLISDYIAKIYRFFYLKDVDLIRNLYELYGSGQDEFNYDEIKDILHNTNLLSVNENEQGLEIITNEEKKLAALNNFKIFLVHNYISNKMFGMIPNIMMKHKNYEDDEMDGNPSLDDLSNDKDEEKQPLGIYTAADFGVDEEDQDYSNLEGYQNENYDEVDGNYNSNYNDMDNYKQVIDKSATKKGNKKGKDFTNAKKTAEYKKRFEKNRALWKFPEKLGSYDTELKTNLALEYVNYICEILGLDSVIKPEAVILKKNCLKIINVEEFSKPTFFKDPCRSFVLKDVICEMCSTCKDIDFCRDESILNKTWSCENCHAKFDKKSIEFLIIKKIQSVIDYYFNQDLECQNCNNQKDEMNFVRCKCAGDFKRTFNQTFFREGSNITNIYEYLQIVMDIAMYYNFNILSNLIKGFLGIK
ncbi:MAG: DUF1744 domain-containing protein, partial [archaeon]|nr:DUF1744 domain-containing protein [archaeon]